MTMKAESDNNGGTNPSKPVAESFILEDWTSGSSESCNRIHSQTQLISCSWPRLPRRCPDTRKTQINTERRAWTSSMKDSHQAFLLNDALQREEWGNLSLSLSVKKDSIKGSGVGNCQLIQKWSKRGSLHFSSWRFSLIHLSAHTQPPFFNEVSP